jgi:hypothetical protein
MAITIIGKAPAKNYEIICTDEDCRNIIRFTHDDVKTVTRSCMGRDAGSVRGISCPDCHQVLPLVHAREVEA